MLAPDLLFSVEQPIDLTSSGLQIIARDVEITRADNTIQVTAYTVPNDRVFILSAASVATAATSPQVARSNKLVMRPESSLPIANALEIASFPFSGQNTNQNLRLNFAGQVWIPSGGTVDANSVFDAGTLDNTILLRVFGLSIPRANIQQG